MKVTRAPGLMKYPYTIEATKEEYQAIRNAVPGENNQGYEIIKAETYHICSNGSDERIVLGKIETRLGTRYVTWQSVRHADGRIADYFWGHYHDSEHAAMHDYYTRLAGKYE